MTIMGGPGCHDAALFEEATGVLADGGTSVTPSAVSRKPNAAAQAPHTPASSESADVGRTREALEAADRAVNWHEPRIVPTPECPDQETALRLFREMLATLAEES